MSGKDGVVQLDLAGEHFDEPSGSMHCDLAPSSVLTVRSATTLRRYWSSVVGSVVGSSVAVLFAELLNCAYSAPQAGAATLQEIENILMQD